MLFLICNQSLLYLYLMLFYLPVRQVEWIESSTNSAYTGVRLAFRASQAAFSGYLVCSALSLLAIASIDTEKRNCSLNCNIGILDLDKEVDSLSGSGLDILIIEVVIEKTPLFI